MKKSLRTTPLWSYGAAAVTAFALGCGFWWHLQKQVELTRLIDDKATRLCVAYSDFSAEYVRLRHYFDRVLLTGHNDVEMTQFQQNLALFVLISQQLQEKEDFLHLLSPEQQGQIRIFIEQSATLLDKSQNTIAANSAQFRNFTQSLFALQDLIDQTSLKLTRQNHESSRMRKKSLQETLDRQNALLGFFMLVATGALLLYLRQRHKTQKQNQTLQKLEAQLQHARDDMAAFNQEKQELLASISHALLPPMQQLLASNEEKSAETLRTEINSIHETLSDLLEIAALDSGMGQLKLEDFDFHALLSTLTSDMLVASRAKGLLLSLEITTDVPIVLHGNAQRIRQILHTLIDNAIKHTQTGRIRINAYAAGRRSKKPRLRVDISDTGPGISQDDLPFIFKRAEATASANGRSIRQARSLARHLQGDLTVASRPMEGTTFTLDLPLTPATDPQ